MQKKPKLLLILAAVVVTIVCATLYFKVHQKVQTDTINTKTEIHVSSEKLVRAFIDNEPEANNNYVEKAVEIKGVVKEVTFVNNRYSIFLNGGTEFSSVMCAMKEDQYKDIQNLKNGQSIILKGICKGFLMDVIFLDCILVNSLIDE